MTSHSPQGRPSASYLLTLAVGVSALALLAGCAKPYKATLSPDLANQLNDTLSFSQIKAAPDDYKGKLIILGGQILSAKRLPHATELIILQLPLIQEQEPTTDLTQSQGRYIAYQQTFLDPATVPAGTRITLVGELSGSLTQKLDETDYIYPTLTIKDFKIWPTYSSDYPRYVHPYPYYCGLYPYPYAYPYWGPGGRYYGYNPYWYW
ncbi:MAG: Slp family lipoprotein [Nitrospirota bacterium]|nr:Slp family lipoprotein [Nitrospirota bacterium]